MPAARREAVRLCVTSIFSDIPNICKEGKDSTAIALEILGGVLSTSDESLKVNASELQTSLLDVCSSSLLDDRALIEAALLIDDLSVVYRMSTEYDEESSREAFWKEQSDLIAIQLSEMRSRLSKIDPRIALERWWRMEMTTLEVFSLFGPKACFTPGSYPMGTWYRTPICGAIIEWSVTSPTPHEDRADEFFRSRVEWMESQASILSKLLVDCEPWFQQEDIRFPLGPFQSISRKARKGSLVWPTISDVAEAVIMCLAVISEIELEDTPERKDESAPLSDYGVIYRSRREEDARPRAHEIIDERCSSLRTRERMHLWVDGNFSFILSSASSG